jgi:hypothetical protein
MEHLQAPDVPLRATDTVRPGLKLLDTASSLPDAAIPQAAKSKTG